MHQSRVDSDFNFDSEMWVVSIINASRPEKDLIGSIVPGGHAMLVVEGEDAEQGIDLYDGEPPVFIGFYDISAPALPEQSNWTFNPKGRLYVKHKDTTMGNKHDEIRRIYDIYLEHKYPHESHQVLVDDAKRMISAIETEAQEWNHHVDDETGVGGQDYQRWGNRGLLVDPDGGHNCSGWCEEKLKIAIPDYEPRGLKSKPQKSACVLL